MQLYTAKITRRASLLKSTCIGLILQYIFEGHLIQKTRANFEATVVLFFEVQLYFGLIPVAARSRAWVCDRSLAGITGSNPAGGMYVCLL